jgi:hypothetical protein
LDGLSVDNRQFKLQLSGKGVSAARLKESTLKIVTPNFTLTVPATALPSNADGADYLTLKVDTAENAVSPGNIAGAISQNKDYSATGLVFNLQLVTTKNGVETQLHQFGEDLKVERTLTSEQLADFDPDYAGVYFLNGDQVEYMGGEFVGKAVSFKTNHFSEFAVLEYHKNFVDMAGNWAESYTQKLAAKHIIDGVDANHFAPNKAVTRADFAVMAVKALGFGKPVSTNPFKDIKPGMYYTSYVAKASELGIIEGNKGLFRPSDIITREEAAVILLRFYQYEHKADIPVATGTDFADIGKASTWAQASIRSAQALGLVNGKGGNRYDPKSSVTRAEISKLIITAMQK